MEPALLLSQADQVRVYNYICHLQQRLAECEAKKGTHA